MRHQNRCRNHKTNVMAKTIPETVKLPVLLISTFLSYNTSLQLSHVVKTRPHSKHFVILNQLFCLLFSDETDLTPSGIPGPHKTSASGHSRYSGKVVGVSLRFLQEESVDLQLIAFPFFKFLLVPQKSSSWCQAHGFASSTTLLYVA